MVLDFATSVVAEGKVRVAFDAGKSIPEGWVIRADGQPTTDPKDLYEGGKLLPAAGHKGYGLAMLMEFLGGALVGLAVLFESRREAVLARIKAVTQELTQWE